MSRLKANDNLFIGKEELNRLMKFMDEDGFRRFFSEETVSYGLIKTSVLGDFGNGRVEAGTNSGTVKIGEINIINKDFNFLYYPDQDNLTVPNDSSWYWVQVEYLESNIEVGTFEIDDQGNLVGVGSKLTDILRGKPNHPSVVRFVNSSFNILEYEITDIIDDENAVLAGEFTAETNLKLAVIGTFEPIPLEDADKYIFVYDSLQLNLVLETVSNTSPTLTPNVTFNLARVSIQSGQVVVEDKRDQYWETEAVNKISYLPVTGSALFGIESVKWDHPSTPLVSNIVELAWGFTATNWTINTNLNRVTISGGSGGQFEDPSFFANGNFDGWRVYNEAGKFSIIKTSVKSGSQINLELDVLDPDNFDISQTLIITPNVEEVEIIAAPNPSDVTDQPNERFIFPANLGKARIRLIAYNSTSLYNIQYRYKNNLYYSQWFLPPNNSRFLTEVSFTDLGILKLSPDRVYFSYTPDSTNGFIQLKQNINAYTQFVNRIDLNDLFGIEYISDLEAVVVSAPSRKVDFQVGVRKQNVIITGSAALTGEVRYNLLTASAKEGSRFFIYQKSVIDNGNVVSGSPFTIKIYQNNTTVLLTLTNDQINKGEQYFICTFDGTNWQITPFDKSYNGDSAYRSGSEAVDTLTNISTISGKNILVVTGYYETILISNGVGGNYTIDGIKTLNGKTINNLKLINKSSDIITLSDYTTYASPPTGVLRFSSGLSDNRLRYVEDCISFSLDNTNLAYVKLGDSVLLTKLDDGAVTSAHTVPGSGGGYVSFSPSITYTIPTGPNRVYQIIARGTFNKFTSTNPDKWYSALRLTVNGSQIVDCQKRLETVFPSGGVTAHIETLNLQDFKSLSSGDIIELQYACDFDDYTVSDIKISTLGFPN